MPENRYGFCGTRPTVRDSSAGSRSRTSTPSTRTVPPVTSNSRGTRLSSVVLPLPVLPMTAVVSPGLGDQVDAAAAPAPRRPGSGSRPPRSSSWPCPAQRGHRLGRRHHAGLGVEHLLDALGADLGPRDHHEHEGRHHDRHQDLHAGSCRNAVSAPICMSPLSMRCAAEPEHGHAGDVDDQHDGREHQRHQPADRRATRRSARCWPRRSGPARARRGRTPGSPGCR